MTNKFVICLIIFILCGASVFAQNPGPYDWWYTLERGKTLFRQGDYSSALLAFEDARRQRQTMYNRMERDFIDLLSLREVRRLNDSLDWVERYIQERHYSGAADALNELYYRVPRDRFNNSAAAALTALGSLKDYPEAEYWIGETYLIEGELDLAQKQFQKTLDMRSLLENPGFETELRYKIAAIRRVRQDYREMERVLLAILDADRLWIGSGGDGDGNANSNESEETTHRQVFERQAMTRTLETSGIDRFLTMYRYSNVESLDAHRLLGFYYYNTGRHSRAQEHLMFAFLIQNTIIIDEVSRRQFDYSFNALAPATQKDDKTPLEKLADEINQNRLLVEYAEKTEYYKTAYYLGASLYATGKAASARGIWNFLATQTATGEWQSRSLAQLKTPHVERVLESL